MSKRGWINSSFKIPGPSTSRRAISTDNKSRKKLQYASNTTISSKKENSTWTDMFTPKSKDDLAVHKKKVCEVEDWLKQWQLNKGLLLLMTGPAGCGKTATIKTLAQELNIEICEWSSSLSDSGSKSDFTPGKPFYNSNPFSESQTNAFSNFLLRAGRYSSLFSKESKKIILIEEFPNVFLKDPASFHNILRNYCLSATCLTVFIISDCTKGESFEHRLFPKNLQSELDVTHISFNPVASTMLLKVINRINACAKDFDKRSLSQSEVDGLVSDCNGDIRNAINLLQFYSSKSNSTSANEVCTPVKSRKIAKKSGSRSDESSRTSSLFLFHALGKVLYCKRDNTKESDHKKLPSHLSHLERYPLISKPEEIFEKTAITADGFSLFLHENYLSFIDDIDVLLSCSTSFSDVDVLSADWTARDVVSDYAASVVTRSLMFNLRPTTGGNRWRPLRKPHCFDVNRNLKSTSVRLNCAFKDSRLTLKELQTDLVPFLFKIGTVHSNDEKNKMVSLLGKMSVQQSLRHHNESLYEKDIILDDVVEDVFTTSSVELKNGNCFVDYTEEYVIEEFDD